MTGPQLDNIKNTDSTTIGKNDLNKTLFSMTSYLNNKINVTIPDPK